MQGGTHVRRLGEVPAAVTVPAGAAAYLHRLGDGGRLRLDWSDLDLWLQVTPLEDVTATLLRLAGLAIAYWVLGSTALYLAARASRIPAAVRAVEWTTLPMVRRAADRAVAMILAGSAVTAGAAPALAAHEAVCPPLVQHTDTTPLPAGDDLSIPPWPPIPLPDLSPPSPDDPWAGEPRTGLAEKPGVEVEVEEPSPTDGPPAALADELGIEDGTFQDPSPTGDPPASPAEEPAVKLGGLEDPAAGPAAPLEPSTDAAPEPPRVSAEARRYEVTAGDNLWVIAEGALADAWGRGPSVAEVASYWRSVIDGNTARLRSGDPDLIHPGELIALPAVPTPEESNDA